MMFEGWQTFYQMTAEAAATLIGLVFIVVSLTAGRRAAGASAGLAYFTTPTVFHLASVLVVSALALAPEGAGHTAYLVSPTALMLAWSLAALACAVHVMVGIVRMKTRPHWSDFWWYGAGPTATFAVLAVACGLAWEGVSRAPALLALAILVLLLVAIRNAWDLATWLAHPREDGSGDDGQGS